VGRLLEGAGFRDVTFVQTLFQDLSQIRDIEPVQPEYGTTSFIVAEVLK
jgi:hypothetical protein